MSPPHRRHGEHEPRARHETRVTADAWTTEPLPGEERSPWNPDAPVWQAWNGMSPEYEFCEFVGGLARVVKPALVIETGVGQGFATRRIAAGLPPSSVLMAFESDEAWRARLASLPFFDGLRMLLADEPTPSDDELATADLFVADSGFRFRFDEVSRWAERAKKGSYIVVHDTGNGHPHWTPHHKLGELIASLAIDGIRLPNPRGSFVGQR
jgi:hypothetical protein